MNCKNCESSLPSNSNYCGICGAKIIRNRLTVKNLFSTVSKQLFNYDNKFLQTFRFLLFNPGNVIACYINGVRKRFVNPIGFLMIAITISGVEYFLLSKYFQNFYNIPVMTSEGIVGFNDKIGKFIQEYQSFILISMIPIFALMSKIVFLERKEFNYTEHLVLYTYLVAQIAILDIFFTLSGAFLGYNFGDVSIFILALTIVYSAYCLKQLFHLSLKRTIIKIIIFLLVFIAFYLALMLLISIALIVFNGDLFIDELQKAQQTA